LNGGNRDNHLSFQTKKQRKAAYYNGYSPRSPRTARLKGCYFTHTTVIFCASWAIISPLLFRKYIFDRRIRLQGYEIYRFGGAELYDDQRGKTIIVDFFNALFRQHSIKK
jgi:hypothetical protein